MFLDDKPQGTPTVEPVKVGTLRLSEAIRIGAKLRPQSYKMSDGIGTCAIGAAYEGAFGEVTVSTTTARKRLEESGIWPRAIRSSEVFEKNDDGMSREQIADWLESQGY